MKNQKEITQFTLLIVISILFYSCNKEEDNNKDHPIESQLIASPDELLINDDETKTLFLSVQPSNEFQWNVSSKPDWININPSSGIINNEIIELLLTPDPTGLSQGKHFGEIEIITNGAGKVEVNIQLCVEGHPIAVVNPNELFFTADDTEKTITISNSGTGFLNWEIQGLPNWIQVNVQTGVLDEGKEIKIVAVAQRNGLPVGTHKGTASIVSNSETGDNVIDFTLEVTATAILSTSVSSLNFGYFENSQSFFIKNEGNIPIDWNINNNSNTFISSNLGSGNLPVGESTAISLNIDRSTLHSETHNLEVIINYNEDKSIILPIQINQYQEEKWLIEGRVIDAEYDKVNDVIIVVSEAPNEIRKYHVSNITEETLTLNIPPNCVSVSRDGNYAAVGHNGSFTYVNLKTMEIEDNYAVTANAFDIVLAPNDWVYVFPREDQWETIRCVDLSTGVETKHTGNFIYDKTRAKLHPSGKYIYGANNGLSPSDFEKYDVAEGTAKYLYDSPYHGDFSFGGDIWIAEDGYKLFAKSRNVFNALSNQENDLTYNGVLKGEGNIKTLDYSSSAEKVYAIFTTGNIWEDVPGNEVRIYDSKFLAFKGTKELPGFLIPNGSGNGDFYKSQGFFGFFNSSSTHFYVLVKVEEGSGAQNEWAIVTINVE